MKKVSAMTKTAIKTCSVTVFQGLSSFLLATNQLKDTIKTKPQTTENKTAESNEKNKTGTIKEIAMKNFEKSVEKVDAQTSS
jgi:hypothetical protein